MSRSLKSRRVITLVLCTLLPLASHGDAIRETMAGNASFDSIGRAATPAELADWDSNIRDDFQGLKAGSGSVLQGKALYEAQCLSCHGASGTEVIVFSPLVGGFTKNDVENGVVKAFEPPISVAPSTLMRVPTLATVMDYIGRAMPWDNPKSLASDQVYALPPTSFTLAAWSNLTSSCLTTTFKWRSQNSPTEMHSEVIMASGPVNRLQRAAWVMVYSQI